MKKLVSFVLALVMAASLLPVQAWGATVVASGNCGNNGGNVTWTLDSDGVLTISGTGEMKDYVSSDSAPWYSQRKNIKNVQILDGVTSIGNSAFEFTSLTSVSIPNSVTYIGVRAFGYCRSLTSVSIPDSVTTIGACAFCFCSSLTSVTIPDSVTTIGEEAFSYCHSLTNVTIPSNVTSIEWGAFSGCSSLTSANIPDSVRYIDEYAFQYCSSLTSVNIPDSVRYIDK